MGHIHRLRRQRRTVKVSKQAMQLIEANSLNVFEIRGTGKGGNITVNDVRKFIKESEPEALEIKALPNDDKTEPKEENNTASEDAEE